MGQADQYQEEIDGLNGKPGTALHKQLDDALKELMESLVEASEGDSEEHQLIAILKAAFAPEKSQAAAQ